VYVYEKKKVYKLDNFMHLKTAVTFYSSI